MLIAGAVLAPVSLAAPLQDEFVLWPDLGYFRAYPIETDERRFIAYATLDLGYDDNLFRLSDAPGVSVFGGDDRADVFAKLGVGARASVDLSLQKFNFNANVDRYMFDRFSLLDKWVYSADADWLWRIGDRLHGDIGYQRSQRLPDFAELQFASDDVILQQYAHASLALRLLSRIEARALAEETRYEHDDSARAALDNQVRAGTVGLVYTSPAETTVGVQHKVSEGDYPNRQVVGLIVVANQYRETESSFIFTKGFDSPGGFDLRVGQTERLHDEVPQRDFEGVTGRAHVRYAVRPKVTIDIAAFRELRAIEELSASYAIVSGGSLGPAWAPTVKTVLQVAYVYEEREFGGDPGFALTSLPPREDRTRAGRLAVGYKPSKNLQFGLSYEHGMRDANVLFADYEYNLVQLHIVGSL
jgi:exopolysaccharide biosynthesis operon protein EpsL